jgi:hypothetical protein
MVASYNTVQAIVAVVERHVDPATFKAIVEDLMSVEGNASFKDTIRRLLSSVERREAEGGR